MQILQIRNGIGIEMSDLVIRLIGVLDFLDLLLRPQHSFAGDNALYLIQR